MLINKKLSESELIELLKSKSESAYSYLYDNYAPALYGVIMRIVNDSDRAKDVLQETFIKIWKNQDNYQSIKGSIFTWMINIAKNSAIDSNRSKHVKYNIHSLDSIVNTSKDTNNSQSEFNSIGMIEVINSLRDDYKSVINYIYILGYTQQEFSDEFNIPLGTVKSRTRLALIELRKKLDIIG